MEILGVISRFVHIASAVALLGAVLFARYVLTRPEDLALLSRYARIFVLASALSFASGLYNLLMKSAVPPGYHAIFGIKFLLALHIYAVAPMVGRQNVDPAKRRRQLTGMVASGTLILILGAVLRMLTQR